MSRGKIYAADPTGFEPAIFSVTGRRVKPGYTTGPTISVLVDEIYSFTVTLRRTQGWPYPAAGSLANLSTSIATEIEVHIYDTIFIE